MFVFVYRHTARHNSVCVCVYLCVCARARARACVRVCECVLMDNTIGAIVGSEMLKFLEYAHAFYYTIYIINST